MANKKISQLTETTTLNTTDVVPVAKVGEIETKKFKFSTLLAWIQDNLIGKFNTPTGTTSQYIRGDGSLATLPTGGDAINLITEVYNESGATLTKGTIVYINGGHGNLPSVAKALATGDSTSAQTYGLVREDISNMSSGYVIQAGLISDINTNAFSDGTQLYLSPTTAGAYTSTKPSAPNHLVYVGIVVYAHPTHGTIQVKIQNGYELDEIHDVAISSVANNQGIFWDSVTSLWKNKTIATALGFTPVTDARTITINGTTQNLSANRSWTISGIGGGGSSGYIPVFVSGITIANSNILYNETNDFVGIGFYSQQFSESLGVLNGYYSRGFDGYNHFYADDSSFSTAFTMDNYGDCYNQTGTYGSFSDRILKENIKPTSSKLDDLMKVNIVNYNLIADERKLKQIGVIAQEIEEIFPGLVSEDKKGLKSVKYSIFIPMLIKAMQEQQEQIEELKAKLNS